jgi:hypothetical protein
LLRRISNKDPEHPNETRALLTIIFDEAIERQEFIHKYSTRWDIEVTIRELKTIMGINIRTFENRKIVSKSASETPFSPETDLFEKLYTTDKPSLVDRKGRVYSRWSPGRPTIT